MKAEKIDKKKRTSRANRKIKENKKGQIFLVCAVVMTIYMLSFIDVIYELNQTQFSRHEGVAEFQGAYENFRTETEGFMKSILARYSQIAPIGTAVNATATQDLRDWLDFAETEMLMRNYIAVFEINLLRLLPLDAQFFDLFQRTQQGNNAYLLVECDIDIYMECEYLTIDTQIRLYFRYILSYAGSTITFSYQTITGETFYIGYAQVTVNGIGTTDNFDGTYDWTAPLTSGDTIECIAGNQIRIITEVI